MRRYRHLPLAPPLLSISVSARLSAPPSSPGPSPHLPPPGPRPRPLSRSPCLFLRVCSARPARDPEGGLTGDWGPLCSAARGPPSRRHDSGCSVLSLHPPCSFLSTTHTHTHTHIQIHTQTQRDTHTRTHTDTETQTQRHRHTQIQTQTHTHRDTHTQTDTDTHTHTGLASERGPQSRQRDSPCACCSSVCPVMPLRHPPPSSPHTHRALYTGS